MTIEANQLENRIGNTISGAIRGQWLTAISMDSQRIRKV